MRRGNVRRAAQSAIFDFQNSVLYAINTDPNFYQSSSGLYYQPDGFYSGGTYRAVSSTVPISGTSDPSLYRHQTVQPIDF